MKKKTRIFKHVFLFCLIALIASFCNPKGYSRVSAASKASYEIINKKKTESNQNRTATYLYQLPQLKGSSNAVKKINKSLKADYKLTLENKKRLFWYFDDSNASYKDDYFCLYKCKVTYNQKGYICFKYTCEWYAGGIHNGWEYGLTYRLKDGKKMGIQDVLAGNRKDAKKKIANAYAKKISSLGYDPIMRMDYSDFKFYIKPGKKVIVCFGPYQPMGGNGPASFKMKGKV